MNRVGAANPNWRGGRRPHIGYVMAYAPDHPAAVNGAVLEHRLVVEMRLGRYLTSDEVVHHVNGQRGDNRDENLAVMSQSDHARLHDPLRGRRYRKPPAVRVPRDCDHCGGRFDAIGQKQAGRRFCSQPCYWQYRLGRGQLVRGVAA